MTKDSDLLTIEEAAPKVGIKPDALRQLCKAKQIKHLRVGPKKWLYRFRQEWLDEYLESCVVEVSDSQPIKKRVAKPRSRLKHKPHEQPPEGYYKQFKAIGKKTRS